MVLGGVILGFPISAMVAGASPTLMVTPSTGLTVGEKVSVTGTGLAALNGQLVAVVECGNADSSGKPLAGIQPASSDCYGAESLGRQTLLVTVANGTAATQYPVQTQGIGANKVQCIAKPPANFPCVIAMADVSTMGKALQISAAITFAATTTTTTTTTTTSTTTPSSTTTTTRSTTTTTSGSRALGQGVGVTVRRTAPASLGGRLSLGLGFAATSVTTTTSTAPRAPSAPVTSKLASTGVNAILLGMAVVGFVLLILGYLVLSIARRPRWARSEVSTKSSIVPRDEAPGL
jgi:hypothetical protein